MTTLSRKIFGSTAEPTEQQKQALEASFAALPDNVFFVLFAYYYHGKEIGAIAAEMGKTVNTVERWKLHGEKILRLVNGVEGVGG
jgi:DNA-directed RNA polymerase specialized sigma24 family protein